MALKLLFLLLLICSLTEQKEYLNTTVKSDQADWWQTASFYKIYVKSFKDSDGYGYGDIKGITSRLEYIQNLGVQAIWLSPIFESRQYDDDYDVADFESIQDYYGTLEDFKELVEEAHKKDLKVILDFVPNHTSQQHEWFSKFEGKEEGFEDFYVASNSTTTPNNWLSKYSGKAWDFSRRRQANYYHLYRKEQPDLNYRSEEVKSLIQEAMNFWLTDNSVDGLHMRDVSYLVEDEDLRDETGVSDNDYDSLDHIYTKDQEESYQIVYEWRKFVDELSKDSGDVKVLFAEADTGLESTIKYYGSGSTLGAHFSSNSHLLSLNEGSTADNIAELISDWIKGLPTAYRPNWMLGDYKTSRTASRTNPLLADGYNILTLLLPGIQITYYGDEIAMENGIQTQTGCTANETETCTEDTATSPFQWDNSSNAGFSDGTPWQPVSDKYKDCNVEDQEKDDLSHLSVYRTMQEIRAELKSYENLLLATLGEDETVLHVIRSQLKNKKYDQYEFFFNMEGENVTVVLAEKWRQSLEETVVLASNSDRMIGDKVKFVNGDLELTPYEAIVLEQRASSGRILEVFCFSNLFVLLVTFVFK